MLYKIKDYSVFTPSYDACGEISSPQDEDEAKKEHQDRVLQLIYAECELNSLQYIRKKDLNKYWLLEEKIWPMAVSVAEMQCAKVILSIDEKKHIGKLSFIGQGIIKTYLDADTTKLGRMLLDNSDTYFVSIQEGMIQIEFFFDLYSVVKVADHSEEIKQLRQLRHQENKRYWSLIDTEIGDSKNNHNGDIL